MIEHKRVHPIAPEALHALRLIICKSAHRRKAKGLSVPALKPLGSV